ncbi:HpcH/HpaI aldolase family protein [Ottowia thiooxydans]|uniref:2-keto-3-deoxy-L-rhamnonate aldolase RhmA n=1 Tax=Ottowia thiooxydans TaxID=219182 RepID=A0ABV2Q992_9BURK
MRAEKNLQLARAERVEAPRIGTFIKTNAPSLVEVLGTTGLDFGVLDAEHAPFDRNALDLMLLAGRAAGLPLYVRVPDTMASTILNALDLGACGIVVPRVDSADMARHVVSCARYGGGTRGYSGSPRAADYGSADGATARARGDLLPVICQIESVEGLASVREIAAVAGVDGLFIGRADLALSMGESGSRAANVMAATDLIMAAAREAGKFSVLYASAQEQQELAGRGADWLVVESDQSLMKLAAVALTSANADRIAHLCGRGQP